MTAPSAHPDDPHYLMRSGWLRAAVLGANDGIVSTSSLIVGVAAANPEPGAVLIAGVAGLAAGAMSMAAGEYVSVSSQSDIEKADIARETHALKDTPQEELEGMILQLNTLLEKVGYFFPPDRAPATKLTLRNLLTKPGWNHLEVRTLRGVLSHLNRPRER